MADAAAELQRSALFRSARLAFPVLVVVELVMVLTGVLSPRDAAALALPLAVLLLCLLVVEIMLLRRAYRGYRSSAPDRFTAAMLAVEAVLPRPVGTVLRLELSLQRALLMFVLRKRDVPDGAVAVGCSRALKPLLTAVLVLEVVELVVLELAVASRTWRMVLLALGLVGLWWFLGFAASLVVCPTVLDRRRGTLRLRFSSMVDVEVPLAAVADARAQSSHRGQRRTAMIYDDELVVEVAGSSNVVIELDEAVEVTASRGQRGRVRRLRLWADDPEALLHALRAGREGSSPAPGAAAQGPVSDA